MSFITNFGLVVFLISIFQVSYSLTVTLYEDIEYRGQSREVNVVRCTNFPGDKNDWASSIKTSTCVLLFEDQCCQGKSVKIDKDSNNLVALDFNDKLTAISPCGDYRSQYPSIMKEKWLGHNQTVSKVFEEGDLAIYYNNDMRRDVTWPRDYLKKLWKYVKKTYGAFGPEGGRLHPIFHANVHGSQYGFNSIQNYFDIDSDCRNLIDVVGGSRDAWTAGPTGTDLDVITHEVSHIVEGASKGFHGSPTYRLWGDSKWAEIFIYDAYSALGLTAEKDRWFRQMQVSKEDFPRSNSYWFKNWFYPVYQNHGGSRVLNDYFTMLARHFPKKSNGWEYERDINLGEFVHFFSGAAGADLKAQATTAFTWNSEFEGQLNQAKRDFPDIRY